MSYLIVILVLFFVVAPIIAILPSKQQKQQMAFRQTARAAGVSVALVKDRRPRFRPRQVPVFATGSPAAPGSGVCGLSPSKEKSRTRQIGHAYAKLDACARDKSARQPASVV